jgi:hypothetical protein
MTPVTSFRAVRRMAHAGRRARTAFFPLFPRARARGKLGVPDAGRRRGSGCRLPAAGAPRGEICVRCIVSVRPKTTRVARQAGTPRGGTRTRNFPASAILTTRGGVPARGVTTACRSPCCTGALTRPCSRRKAPTSRLSRSLRICRLRTVGWGKSWSSGDPSQAC